MGTTQAEEVHQVITQVQRPHQRPLRHLITAAEAAEAAEFRITTEGDCPLAEVVKANGSCVQL